MENFIRISEEQFYNYFAGENYVRVSWTGKSKDIPEPPFWMAHRDWIYDLSAKRYVGSETSSSWNPDVVYEILEELATPEMTHWYLRYSAEEKVRRERADKESAAYWKTRGPEIVIDPSKPGLMEFLEEGNIIPYEPTANNIEECVKIWEEVWYGKSKEL